MSKQISKILKNIPSMGMNELELLKQKVYNSLLEVIEKEELLLVIKKKLNSINKDDAMVEVSEIKLD